LSGASAAVKSTGQALEHGADDTLAVVIGEDVFQGMAEYIAPGLAGIGAWWSDHR
jgi:hypothetical protein